MTVCADNIVRADVVFHADYVIRADDDVHTDALSVQMHHAYRLLTDSRY